MVDFIRMSINGRHFIREYGSYRVCVEYRKDDILIYPAEGSTMMLVDEIMAFATELSLNAILGICEKHGDIVPSIILY